jgi:hypothetical protein
VGLNVLVSILAVQTTLLQELSIKKVGLEALLKILLQPHSFLAAMLTLHEFVLNISWPKSIAHSFTDHVLIGNNAGLSTTGWQIFLPLLLLPQKISLDAAAPNSLN